MSLRLVVFLASAPATVGYPKPDNDAKVKGKEQKTDEIHHQAAIGFWDALLIPALFFSKLNNYTFLYWLPDYINESGLNLGDKSSVDLSTLFDFGGIFGVILAGLISDLIGMRIQIISFCPSRDIKPIDW